MTVPVVGGGSGRAERLVFQVESQQESIRNLVELVRLREAERDAALARLQVLEPECPLLEAMNNDV